MLSGGRILPPLIFLLGWFKIVFAHTAERTTPIGGEIFKGGAWGYAAVGVAGGRVINVAAHFANILFHAFFFLGLINEMQM